MEASPGASEATRLVYGVYFRPTRRLELLEGCNFSQALRRFQVGCDEMVEKSIETLDLVLVGIPRFSENYNGRIPVAELQPLVRASSLRAARISKWRYVRYAEAKRKERLDAGSPNQL